MENFWKIYIDNEYNVKREDESCQNKKKIFWKRNQGF